MRVIHHRSARWATAAVAALALAGLASIAQATPLAAKSRASSWMAAHHGVTSGAQAGRWRLRWRKTGAC